MLKITSEIPEICHSLLLTTSKLSFSLSSVISPVLPVFFCSFLLPLLACDGNLSVVEGLMSVTGLGAGLAVTACSHSSGQLLHY